MLLAGCAAPGTKPLVDPFPLRFPLAEAGSLDIDGRIVGQPLARDGIVYLATSDGFLTAVVVPAGRIFWRFRAGHPFSRGPELGQGHIIIRDDAGTLYVLDRKGSLVLRSDLPWDISTAIRESQSMIFFGTEDGKIVMFDPTGAGNVIWESRFDAIFSAGPAFAGDLIFFGTKDGRLLAIDWNGATVWTFNADGAVAADPIVDGNRLFLGTENSRFTCLNARTGKVAWSRRLQGAPLHPAIVRGGKLVVPASNSVVYLLSSRGGSILSWENIPSRIIFPLAAAGLYALVSSATPDLMALDLLTGKKAGQHTASGPLAAAALWASPYVVVFEEAADSGQQRIVILRSR